MAATKRRQSGHSMLDDSSMSNANAGFKDKEEMNAWLMQSCVDTLKSHYPHGMTTKELMAAIDERYSSPVPGMTSSILSTKLNAMFRKHHADSSNPSPSQLEELPLVRQTSKDLPRRLVYTYAGSDAADLVDAPATPPAESEDAESGAPASKRRRLSVTASSPSSPVTPISEGHSSRQESVEAEKVDLSDTSLDLTTKIENTKLDVAVTESKPAEMLPLPPMPASMVASMAAHQKQRQLQAAAASVAASTPTPTSTSVSTSVPAAASKPAAHAKLHRTLSFRGQPQPSPQDVNLYYDNLGVEGLAGTLSPAATECSSPKWDLDLTSEYIPPDALDFDELESLVR